MAEIPKQVFCHRCGEYRLHVQHGYRVPHVLHLLLTILFCGTWAIVWVLHIILNAITEGRRPFLCSVCGQTASDLPPALRRQQEQLEADAAEATCKLKAAAAVDRSIRRNHLREIRRGQWRRLDANIDAAIARAVGEENTILVAAIGGTIRVLAVAFPLAGIVAIIWLLGGW